MADIDKFINNLTAVYRPGQSVGASHAEKLRLIRLAKQVKEMQPFLGLAKWFVTGTPFDISNCPKHAAFFEAGKNYKERFFSMSNRSGKTIAGAYEMACHLTGRYPSFWAGIRFNTPIEAWAIGQTAESTRDTVQKELIGEFGSFGTGMIPRECILERRARNNVPNALSFVTVRHVSGGTSLLGFKSYDQKIEAFYGTKKHVIWFDEEPPVDVYNECLVRTMITSPDGSGGIVYTTATPLAGMTPFVKSFEEVADFLAGSKPCIPRTKEPEIKPSRCVIRGGWDHAPWLSQKQKDEILAATPAHLRKPRSTGEPASGETNVYPVSFKDVSVDPFEIPRHYKRWYGMDTGNTTAAVFFAEDPNTGTMYIYDEYKAERELPLIHAHAIKSRGEWLHGAVDPASSQTSPNDVRKLISIYRQDAGLNLHYADNAVDAGIQLVWQALCTGKLKIFRTCRKIEEEMAMYRTDEDGKIIKEHDHLMDALRYGVMTGRKVARLKPSGERSGQSTNARRYDI